MDRSFKLISFIFFLLLQINNTSAQHNIKLRQIGEIKFVDMNIDILVYFLDQKQEDWESAMKELGFEVMSKEDNLAPIYSKGKLGEVFQCISKDKKGLVSVDWYDYTTKISLMSGLFNFLKPYYYAHQKNINYHSYKKWIIGTENTSDDTYIFERVLIKRNE